MYKIILRDSIEGEHEVVFPPENTDSINITYAQNEIYKTVTSSFAIGLSFSHDALAFIDKIWKRDDYFCEIEIDIYTLESNSYKMLYSGMLDSESIQRGYKSSTFDVVQSRFERSIFEQDDKEISYLRTTDLNGDDIDANYIKLDTVRLTSLPNYEADYSVVAVSAFNLFRKFVYTLTGTLNFRSHIFDLQDDKNNLNTARYAFITDGKYLRGVAKQNNITTSFRSLFENFCKIFGLGMQVEFDNDGSKWVRIDKLEWFHNPQIIANFESIDSLEITLIEKYLFGTVNTGYVANNTGTNETTGNEYNVTSEYSLSKGYNKENYDLVSSFRADGTAFKKAILTSNALDTEGEYDNDLFIVMCHKNGFIYDQNTEALQVSGISGSPFYCNIEISPTRILKNNELTLKIPTVNRTMKLLFNSQKRTSKLSSKLVGEIDSFDECTDLSTDRFKDTYLTPYQAKFKSLASNEILLNLARNSNGLCRFVDRKTDDVLFGHIIRLTINNVTKEADVLLHLVTGNYDSLNLICGDDLQIWQWDDGTPITI